MVSVPVLDALEVFAAIEKVVVPFPVPAAPVLTVIHVTLLTAVQAQPVPAVTVALPDPPAAAID